MKLKEFEITESIVQDFKPVRKAIDALLKARNVTRRVVTERAMESTIVVALPDRIGDKELVKDLIALGTNKVTVKPMKEFFIGTGW